MENLNTFTKGKDMKIESKASWTKIDDSSDTHYDVEMAEAVCRMLREYNEYTPCLTRGVCTDAWVEIDGVRQNDH